MIDKFSIQVNGLEMPDITDAMLNKNNDCCVVTSWTEDGELLEDLDIGSDKNSLYDVELKITKKNFND